MLTRRERAVAFLGTTATEPSALKTLRAGFTRIAAQLGTPTGIHHCLLRVKQPFLCFSYSSSGFDTSVPCWHPCTVTPGSQHPRVSGGGAPAEVRGRTGGTHAPEGLGRAPQSPNLWGAGPGATPAPLPVLPHTSAGAAGRLPLLRRPGRRLQASQEA